MPKNLLYLDCSSGVSGDMLVAALLDCGLQPHQLTDHLNRLALDGWRLESSRVHKNGLAAHKIEFICPPQQQHRHLAAILALIGAAQLPPDAANLAETAFRLLAEAEAAAHGCPVEQVHFHEVGAADAILDICSVALALHLLSVEQVYCSELPLSSGFVDCAHGRIPVPAPATLNLLQGFRFFDSGLTGELITPTGAALLKAMGARQGKPHFTLKRSGIGAGSRDLPQQPNVLRALLGETEQETQQQVEVLHCNLDDSPGEILGHIIPLLLEAGALDVCYTPLMMKKNRPGWQLQVITTADYTHSLAQLIFRETSGIGLRVSREQRITMPRQIRSIATPYGPINVKFSGNNAAPEYEDVAAAARRSGVPYKEVLQQTLAALTKEHQI